MEFPRNFAPQSAAGRRRTLGTELFITRPLYNPRRRSTRVSSWNRWIGKRSPCWSPLAGMSGIAPTPLTCRFRVTTRKPRPAARNGGKRGPIRLARPGPFPASISRQRENLPWIYAATPRRPAGEQPQRAALAAGATSKAAKRSFARRGSKTGSCCKAIRSAGPTAV